MRRLAALLCLFLLLSGCDGPGQAAVTTQNQPTSPTQSGLFLGEDSFEIRAEDDSFYALVVYPVAEEGAVVPTLAEALDGERERLIDYCERLQADAEDRFAERGTTETSSIEAGFSVENSSEGVLSIRWDAYQVIGGAARGENTVRCTNFSLETGERLYWEYFDSDRTLREKAIVEVIAQIEARSEDYFPEYETLARECFPSENFCVTPDGFALFYPELTIGPAILGVARFDIKA